MKSLEEVIQYNHSHVFIITDMLNKFPASFITEVLIKRLKYKLVDANLYGIDSG